MASVSGSRRRPPPAVHGRNVAAAREPPAGRARGLRCIIDQPSVDELDTVVPGQDAGFAHPVKSMDREKMPNRRRNRLRGHREVLLGVDRAAAVLAAPRSTISGSQNQGYRPYDDRPAAPSCPRHVQGVGPVRAGRGLATTWRPPACPTSPPSTRPAPMCPPAVSFHRAVRSTSRQPELSLRSRPLAEIDDAAGSSPWPRSASPIGTVRAYPLPERWWSSWRTAGCPRIDRPTARRQNSHKRLRSGSFERSLSIGDECHSRSTRSSSSRSRPAPSST